ncbi:MAG: hypothetical protein L0Z62_03140, partial [Gemmataceae bacterium]|nr:hypothetical protein [Gemmataceae bacterium]
AAVERLTVVMLPSLATKGKIPPRDELLLFRTKQPYDRRTLLKGWMPDARRRMAGSRYYYTAPDGSRAVAFLNSHVFMLAREVWLKRFLSRPVVPEWGPLGEAIQAARDGNHHLVIGFNQAGYDLRHPVPLEPAAIRPFRSGRVVVHEPGPMRVEVVLTYAQAKAARAAVAAEASQRADRLRTAQSDLIEPIRQPVIGAVLAVPDHPLMVLGNLATLKVEPGLTEKARALKRDADFQRRTRPTLEGSSLKMTVNAPAPEADLALLLWERFSRLAFEGSAIRPVIPVGPPKR